MDEKSQHAIQRVKVREVSGVFRSSDALDAATSALLEAGFDRADIDIMADVDEVAAMLRTGSISAAELADIPSAPRRPLVRPEDVVLVVSCVADNRIGYPDRRARSVRGFSAEADSSGGGPDRRACGQKTRQSWPGAEPAPELPVDPHG